MSLEEKMMNNIFTRNNLKVLLVSAVLILIVLSMSTATLRSASAPTTSTAIWGAPARVTFTSSTEAQTLYSADVEEFVTKAHYCTDKTTKHKFQHVYANVLHKYKYPSEVSANFRMLEIGLGCNMKCVAGGFRLMRSFLPLVEYISFDYNLAICQGRFAESNVTAEEAAYLASHSCQGSSESEEDLGRCGDKFGPFDIIIDDASHQVSHIMKAYWFLFPSKYLKYGGVYVVEDLQTQFVPYYNSGWGTNHMSNYVGDLLRWKMALNPNTGKPSGNVTPPAVNRNTEHYAALTQMVVCGPEVCAFEKVPYLPSALPAGFPQEWRV